MPEPVTKAVAQDQPEQKIKTGNSITRLAGIASVATFVAVFALLVAAVVYAQDKYSLKSPSGIAFSDFSGCEDWSVVSSARTDEVLKVIVGSPTMIKATRPAFPPTASPSRRALGS